MAPKEQRLKIRTPFFEHHQIFFKKLKYKLDH